ncbi:UDP-glucuronic acid decarboxylase family protein [Amnibacterium endophyticum]|uniref:UDP-glucuronic acid decarboxylase family protein n=1 Tax=Amnibacterium endophyticum TaxID=2109337 RepID=A0ABW4LCE9_9MICO
MHVLVSGGAGFLGSHLCETLVARGDSVVAVDDLSTGRTENLAALNQHSRFRLVVADVTEPLGLDEPFDAVVHMASAASPADYHRLPLETLRVGSRGTEVLLELAQRSRARFVLASTSEVYGDPEVHPQREDYWGHVNPNGPRSVYDEAKRYAEAVTAAYRRSHGVNTGIARIFNTYGPRMRAIDGRVVTTFIAQALNGDPITIYGDGSQTRSFCYVDDLIRGLIALVDADVPGPINLGNPTERTVDSLAELVIALARSSSRIEFHPLPQDDPTRRRPDITLARQQLGWEPHVGILDGLEATVRWFASRRDEVRAAATAIAGAQPTGPVLIVGSEMNTNEAA